MEERNLSEQESLRLIQQMINMAKHEQKDDGTGWIIWGWLLFFASLLTYINIYTKWFDTWLFWNMKSFESVMLLHGIAVLAGYIVPGHIAYYEFRKIKRTGV